MTALKKLSTEPQEPSMPSKEKTNKYLCECVDCVGEWTGLYKDQKELEQDILLYCRSGKAKCVLVD